MGNHIYTSPASQVTFVCFAENVKSTQSCQTCHLQGWDKILISLQIRGKILRCTGFHSLDLHTRFSLYIKGTLLSHRNSLCRAGSTSLGTGNEGFSILGMTCLSYSTAADFCALPNSMPSTNTHCHEPVSADFSYLLNRWKFWDELHSVSQSAQSQAQCYHHRQKSPQICFMQS